MGENRQVLGSILVQAGQTVGLESRSVAGRAGWWLPSLGRGLTHAPLPEKAFRLATPLAAGHTGPGSPGFRSRPAAIRGTARAGGCALVIRPSVRQAHLALSSSTTT